MIKVERIEVSGLANALYGMRLPKNSNDKSDTLCTVYNTLTGSVDCIPLNNVTSTDRVVEVTIGDNDMELAKLLVKAGTDHGKWLRQVQVSALITAPMTFFWDFDTYKVSTTKNSSSRMHKITSKLLDENDFSWEDDNGNIKLTPFREQQLIHLNGLIEQYNNEKDYEKRKDIFKELIQDLPDSFNFRAMWTGSAQTCRNYYFARRNHKQKELIDLVNIFANLPEVGEFITLE